MEPSQTSNNTPRQAILLDLSLFILDFLDTNKIKESASIRDHILEVPSALVQMLRDSRVGSPILFLFIYALLVKTINKYRAKQITDSRIVRLVNSRDYEVRGEAWRITQKLFEEFSSLIDIVPKSALPEDINEPEYKSDDSEYPIRRYDFIGSFSHEEQLRLQQIYTRELNLPVHPLYDQYFSQVFHAQSIGVADVTTPRRRSVSLDEETFKIVSDWKGHVALHEKSDSNIIQSSREFLRWFTLAYMKDEWKGMVFDATLELAVAGVMAGTIAGTLGLSLVTLAGGTILKAVVEAPPTVLPDIYKPVVFGAVLLLMIVCLITVFKPTWFIPKILPTPSPTFIQTSLGEPLLQDLIPTPTITSMSLITVAAPAENIATATLVPINSTNASDSLDYCLYVIQSGDTVQSVASWFYVSESDIRNSDRRVNQDMFVVNQLVRINVPCCKHIGIENGFSYTVQPKDNVFRLAERYSTTVKEITVANKLSDSRYIQTGQMLCVPYP
ncbi:MAG: LysM peptidoglycan-binding domain-containing protein [Anaerolineales bacterium]|nr:LysM peptidoglycan-binding domain-containing protein [Anaerolineales bacterium]